MLTLFHRVLIRLGAPFLKVRDGHQAPLKGVGEHRSPERACQIAYICDRLAVVRQAPCHQAGNPLAIALDYDRALFAGRNVRFWHVVAPVIACAKQVSDFRAGTRHIVEVAHGVTHGRVPVSRQSDWDFA